MAVEASIIVDFGDDVVSDQDIVVIELDETHPNNLKSDNTLKSNFAPGERPVFLIHHADTVKIDAVKSTDGKVTQLSSIPVNRVRNFEFTFLRKDDTQNLSYSGINSFVSSQFFGNNVSLNLEESIVSAPSGTFPSIGEISFSVPFQRTLMLIPPVLNLAPDETYKILIVVYASRVQ